MKKLFLGLLVAVGFSMNAQVTFKPGLRGGLNLSSITQSRGDFKPDFFAGAFGELKFGRRYAFQPEITYSRQGAQNVTTDYYNYDFGASQRQQRVDLNYLSLATINKIFFTPKFRMLVGPTFDILLSDNLLHRESDVDLGIMLGFEYATPSGFAFDIRCKKGIVDVLESEYYRSGSDYFFGDYNTNIVFQFGVSYIFDFKKKQ